MAVFDPVTEQSSSCVLAFCSHLRLQRFVQLLLYLSPMFCLYRSRIWPSGAVHNNSSQRYGATARCRDWIEAVRHRRIIPSSFLPMWNRPAVHLAWFVVNGVMLTGYSCCWGLLSCGHFQWLHNWARKLHPFSFYCFLQTLTNCCNIWHIVHANVQHTSYWFTCLSYVLLHKLEKINFLPSRQFTSTPVCVRRSS